MFKVSIRVLAVKLTVAVRVLPVFAATVIVTFWSVVAVAGYTLTHIMFEVAVHSVSVLHATKTD